LVDVNTHFSIEIDGKQILKLSDIETITNNLEILAKEQTSCINSLDDFDKIRKGAQLSYYLIKNFYCKYWSDWYNPKIVDNSLKQLGDKFLKSGAEQKNRSPKELSMLFDPSNEYF
jgi:hypothetical protein